MRNPKNYSCYLEVSDGGKSVPYGGGPRDDGSYNYGFKNLKGNESDIYNIEEAKNDPALLNFLLTANRESTPFFTVGCLSFDVDEDSGFRRSGYVEFCFNDRNMVNDGIAYFQMFWAFTQHLKAIDFKSAVQFNWELLGATFIDADCHGMTCTITINTQYHQSLEEATEAWTKTLEVISDIIKSANNVNLDKIYK